MSTIARPVRSGLEPGKRGEVAREVRAAAALGPATIKLLDHHRVPLVTRRETIQQGETVFAFHSKAKVGAIYLQLGAFRDWVVGDSYGQIAEDWGSPPASDE